MNWYQIFYWVTVADSVKLFFEAFAWIFTSVFIASCIGYFFCTNAESESKGTSYEAAWGIWTKAWKRIWTATIVLMPIFWAGNIFCPSKKDAIVIIAGGAVGNFVTSDSSARQIPAELTLLIREKMRSEIEELREDISPDTLKDKTKEELIELLKRK
jgi:hypothetical protein